VPIVTIALLYPASTIQGIANPEGEAILNGFNLALASINSDPLILANYELRGKTADT